MISPVFFLCKGYLKVWVFNNNNYKQNKKDRKQKKRFQSSTNRFIFMYLQFKSRKLRFSTPVYLLTFPTYKKKGDVFVPEEFITRM